MVGSETSQDHFLRVPSFKREDCFCGLAMPAMQASDVSAQPEEQTGNLTEQAGPSSDGAAAAAAPAARNPPSWSPLDLSAEAVARKENILSVFRAEMVALKKAGKFKEDMQAYKKLKEKHTLFNVYGHIPGVRVGEVFNGRGELAILGLHTRILQGIDGSPSSDKGALAIVLSGGYKDDDDSGTTFWYTGQGGNDKGRQVAAQAYTQGNAALRTSFLTGMPVRVMRGRKDAKQVQYTYDGLYIVKNHKMEASAEGPQVIKFLMEGIPGESVASLKVQFNSLFRRNPMLSQRLAAADDEDDEDEGVEEDVGRGKRRRQRQAPSAKRRTPGDASLARERRLEEIRATPGVVLEDLSCGLERLPIPVINAINDAPAPNITYITDYEFSPFVEELVRPLLEEEEKRLLDYLGGTHCGLAYSRDLVQRDLVLDDFNVYKRKEPIYYNHQGRLIMTHPFGVHECCDKCTASKACQANKQVSNGLNVPLEVFMTADRGWGVRCSTNLKAGQFVVCYIGEVITEAMADKKRGCDEYLFDLDHFPSYFKEVKVAAEPVPEWHLPPTPPTELHLKLSARIKEAKPALEAQLQAAKEEVERRRVRQEHEAQDKPEGKQMDKGGEGKEAGVEEGAAERPGSSSGDAEASVSAPACGPAAQSDKGSAGGSGEAAARPAPSSGEEEAAPALEAGTSQDRWHGTDPSRWTDAALQEALTEGVDDEVLLAIDALNHGNVARFINHSCDPNLTIQTIFTKKARNLLLYYHALFASEDIPANTELTYTYGEAMTHVAYVCRCGSDKCISRADGTNEHPAS